MAFEYQIGILAHNSLKPTNELQVRSILKHSRLASCSVVSEREGKVATNMFRSRIVRVGDRDVGTPISDNMFAGRFVRDIGRSAVFLIAPWP